MQDLHDTNEGTGAHPEREADVGSKRLAAEQRAIAARHRDHPAGRVRLRLVPPLPESEDGSLVAEYGLLVVLGATITMLATKWATGGAIWELFAAVLAKAKALAGL